MTQLDKAPRRAAGAKLQFQRVQATDQAKVVAFLRFAKERLKLDWWVVTTGEVDVLVVGDDTSPAPTGGAVITLCLARPDAPRRNGFKYLHTPLQYQDFVEALDEIEHNLSRTVELPTLVVTVPDYAIKEACPTNPVPLEAAFRLRRWPPASILNGDRYRLRLASFLSTRHLELNELARLSNVAPSQCHDFLMALSAADLLDSKMPSPPTEPTKRPASPAQPSVPRRTPEDGLFNKIRRSLGIVWRQ